MCFDQLCIRFHNNKSNKTDRKVHLVEDYQFLYVNDDDLFFYVNDETFSLLEI